MANVTDPLVNQLSGSDPQNLMEYITRQKIYDSRYWKEECFGLTVSDVLEKLTAIVCIGNLPCHCLKLTLKLLQLHPEHDLIRQAFVEQDEFKYVKAVGCLYIRLTSRPVEIYETLEACYADFRKLRVWQSHAQTWTVLPMDEYIHQLLTAPTDNCLGIALPRLPARAVLQEAGYLPDGPRPTALKDVLTDFGTSGGDGGAEEEGNHKAVLEYLKHKALVEKCPAAIAAWERRQEKYPSLQPKPKKARVVDTTAVDEQGNDNDDMPRDSDEPERKSKKVKKKKKERNYGNLFKRSSTSKSDEAKQERPPSEQADEEGSEEYWNQERAKLGLVKLK